MSARDGYPLPPPGVIVLVLGIPSAGNRLWRDMAVYNGAADGRVHHFGQGFERHMPKWLEDGYLVRAVQPVREAPSLFASLATHHQALKRRWDCDTWDELVREHYYRTAHAIARWRIPTIPVKYEELVKAPEAYARPVMEWLGLRWRGLHKKIEDQSAKYGHPILETA